MEQTERVAAISKALGMRGIEVLQALDQAGLPIDVLDALIKPIAWTAEKPTQEGWYWYRRDDHVMPIKVFAIDIPVCGRTEIVLVSVVDHEDFYVRVEGLDGMFAGPMEPPR